MVNKVISGVMLTTSIVFLALANSQPDNILFLFLSSNKLIAVSRIVLAAGMVALSFKGLIEKEKTRQSVKYAGLGLILFGILSMLMTGLSSAMYDYVKLIDVMIIAEAGVIFTSCALTLPQAQSVKAPRSSAKPSLKLRQKTA